MTFDHYVISRFNLRIDPDTLPPDEKWMVKYLKLFENYCYRSLLNQTNKTFNWIVLFDDETTDKKLLKKFSRIRPIFIKNYKKRPIEQISRMIQNESDKDFIITSRIDVDDCFHKNYIQAVQSKFQSIVNKKEVILNFRFGYIRDLIKKKLYLEDFGDYPNPFISLLEKRDKEKLLTCSYDMHSQMTKYFEFFNMPTRHPMWIQNIHGSNISNIPRGVSIIDLKSFGVK